MIISLIAATGSSGQLGLGGKLPWSLKDDLKNFRRLTSKHTILMGRKTFESIGKPLPNRANVIITRNNKFKSDGCVVLDSVEKGISFAKNNGEDELFIIGGGEIYKYCLERDLVDKIYLTTVDFDGAADTFFPELDESLWKVIESENFCKNEGNEFDFKVTTLVKSQL